MTRERLYLFDTTLRDGQQTPGIDFSLEDKILVAGMLDELGLDYVEGGYPGANPTDTAFFSRKRTHRAAFTAFGMVKRAGRSASNDPGLQDLLRAEADAICFVAKSWDFHVRLALGCSNEENLEVDLAIGRGLRRRWARDDARLRAFLRRLQGQSRTTRSPASRRRCKPARDGRCCATPTAARCPTRWSASSATVDGALPGRAHRHPRAQRHGPGGGEFARRGARRRAADPGHAERHRRALRQRRSRIDHPDADAEAGFRRALRDWASRRTG